MLHVRNTLDAMQQITHLLHKNKKNNGGRLGWSFQTGDQTMVLVSTFLSLTARRRALRATISVAGTGIARLLALIAASGQALSDAQELRRVMTRKHPFMDI
jgi:hypothetical protein